MWNAILQFHFCKRKTSFESFFVSIRPRACFSPSYNKVKSQTNLDIYFVLHLLLQESIIFKGMTGIYTLIQWTTYINLS